MIMPSDGPAGLVQTFECSARKSWRFYLLTLLGAVFFLAPLAVDPARDCVAYPCEAWLHRGAMALGLLFCVGALTALWRNHEWGSRVDLDARAIVWRYGPAPAPEHRIALDDIAVIRLDDTCEGLGLWLKDRDGKVLSIPDECVPQPPADWAAALMRVAPHIRLEQRP
jgi:hypothetical protein